MFNSWEEITTGNCVPQRCLDKGNDPTTETVLVACIVFVTWSILGSQQKYKSNMTQWGATI